MNKQIEALHLKINGLEVLDNSVYNVELSDADSDSYRSVADAHLIRNRIRKDIYKINLEFSISHLQRLHDLLMSVDDETFDVEFYDIYSQQIVKKPMYCGNRTYGYIVIMDGDFKTVAKGLKFNLIET